MAAEAETETNGDSQQPQQQPKRSRFSSSLVPATVAPSQGLVGSAGAADKQAKAAALQQSIAACLAALKQKRDTGVAASTTTATTMSETIASTAPAPAPAKKRAKVYDVDFSVTKPSFKMEEQQDQEEKEEKPRRGIFNPYLSHSIAHQQVSTDAKTFSSEQQQQQQVEEGKEDEVLLDGRLAGGHTARRRVRYKPLTFIEPGTFVKIAERKREKAVLAAKSGFFSGRKEGTFVKSTGMVAESGLEIRDERVEDAVVYGSTVPGQGLQIVALKLCPEEDPSYVCPLAMEWWDVELLPIVKRERSLLLGRKN